MYSLEGGPVHLNIKDKLKLSTLPFFQKSGKRTLEEDGFDAIEAIRVISKNRERIPTRYWNGTKKDVLRLASEETRLQDGDDLQSDFYLIGQKGEKCKMTASTNTYTDAYECESEEFSKALIPLRWNRSDLDALKELYVLVKDNLEVSDLMWCKNMEVRRDTIKRIDYSKLKKHAKILDSFEEYDLLDLYYKHLDFGRFLKMVDSTSHNVYLLYVPRVRDFGSVKIPMNTCKQALAWSYEKQVGEYAPEIET